MKKWKWETLKLRIFSDVPTCCSRTCAWNISRPLLRILLEWTHNHPMLLVIFKSWFPQKYGKQQHQYLFSITENHECTFARLLYRWNIFFPTQQAGCIVTWTLLFTAICVFEGVCVCVQGESVCDVLGGRGDGGGVDSSTAIISLTAIWILLLHYNSNHQEPPDEIFIMDLRIQAFLITIC